MTATASPVRAGQLYRARCNEHGRYRFLRVLQVRSAGYALVREVTEEGKPVHGRDGNGLRRSDPFVVMLAGGMLGTYTLLE